MSRSSDIGGEPDSHSSLTREEFERELDFLIEKHLGVTVPKDDPAETSQAHRAQSVPRTHKPLPPHLSAIVRQTQARVVGFDMGGQFLGEEQLDQDLGAVEAMNNSLVLNPQALEAALKSREGKGAVDAGRQIIDEYAKRGWQVSEVSRKLLRQILSDGGYSFLLEHQGKEKRTPIGYQFGFPFTPPLEKYPNLALETLPQLTTFKDSAPDSLVIWRSGILWMINEVRIAYEKLNIPWDTDLENTVLHRLGGGQATKVVASQAGVDLQKKFLQFNIGNIVRPGHEKDVIATNEASLGSNTELVDSTGMTRIRIDTIEAVQGKALVEIYWTLFRSDPRTVLDRSLRDGSAVRVKGWSVAQLQETGHHLARILREGLFQKILGK